MIKYNATYVKPGTLWPDEATEMIPAGWWIHGWSDANDESPDVVLYVDHSVDEDGNNTARETASRIADLLNASQQQESQPPAEEAHCG